MALAAAGALGAGAMTFLPVAGATASAAVDFAQAQARFLNEKFKQAFGGYDLEKVFWQTVFSGGILVAAKLAYEAYKWVKQFTIDPFGWIAGGFIKAGESFLMPFRYCWEAIVWAFKGFPEEEEEEPTDAEIAEARKKYLDKLGIPVFVDQIFNEWLVYFILAVMALPAIFEARRVRQFKRGM